VIQNGDACRGFVRGTLTFAWDVCRRRDRNWRAHNLTVAKHRADGPCTNAPALARALALCPKGDPCRRLRELTAAQSTLVVGVT